VNRTQGQRRLGEAANRAVTRDGRGWLKTGMYTLGFVIPAKAGIQGWHFDSLGSHWL
jgi:hypothetical protein